MISELKLAAACVSLPLQIFYLERSLEPPGLLAHSLSILNIQDVNVLKTSREGTWKI